MDTIPHHRFGNIRVVTIEHEPWFCAKDVALALGYTKPRNAITRHVRERQQCTYETLHGRLKGGPETGPPSEVQPHAIFVNESGMYSLVLGSKLDTAEEFKDWICEAVLPSIR